MPWLRRHGVFVLSLLLAGLVWALLHFAAAAMLNQLEERAGDMVWRLSAERKDERRLIVVDVDERSLREVGPWPWPRATQGRLVEQIANLGARQQIFDIVFTDPQADDAALVQAVQQQRPVLAQVFALEQGGQPSVGQLAGALDWSSCPAPFGAASGYLANFAALSLRRSVQRRLRQQTWGTSRRALPVTALCGTNPLSSAFTASRIRLWRWPR